MAVGRIVKRRVILEMNSVAIFRRFCNTLLHGKSVKFCVFPATGVGTRL